MPGVLFGMPRSMPRLSAKHCLHFLTVVGIEFDALSCLVVHPIDNDVGVMVRQQIIGQRVGMILVMVEVDAMTEIPLSASHFTNRSKSSMRVCPA